jgi:hypothetical protein
MIFSFFLLFLSFAVNVPIYRLYKKPHVEHFSIVDCFKAADIVDQNAAEEEFTRIVINMSKWKQCPEQRWAQEQIDSQFMVMTYRHGMVYCDYK